MPTDYALQCIMEAIHFCGIWPHVGHMANSNLARHVSNADI